MFESAEIGHKIDKKDYKLRAPVLREALLGVQYQLLESAQFPVIIIVNGVGGAGKGDFVNLLNEWMDPRHIRTEAFAAMTDDERVHPEMWRFWQVLPAKGRIGILFGSWYTDPILTHVMDKGKEEVFGHRLERIRQFERMLVAEGALLIKLWFHLSKVATRKRYKALEADPKTAWRVTRENWKQFKYYDTFITVCEQALRKTSTGEAPWRVIDGSDQAYLALTAGEHILDALNRRLVGKAVEGGIAAPVPPPTAGRPLATRSF